MTKNKMGALASAAVLALGLAACGSSSKSSSSSTSSGGSTTISGAGSTFAAPVYEQWASSLAPLTVNYQAVGSGAGITALEAKTVDFGASDPPLKPADFAAIEKVGPPRADPDVPRSDNGLLQPAGREERPQARRQDDRQHLPRQDHDLE